MANRIKLTPEKKDEFLRHLVDSGGNVTVAAKAVGMARRYMYEVKEKPEESEFSRAWDEAVEEGVDLLEDEVKRRAFDGYEEPVHYKGVLVDVKRCYSDYLAVRMLQARRPEKWCERLQTKNDFTSPLTVNMNFGDVNPDE